MTDSEKHTTKSKTDHAYVWVSLRESTEECVCLKCGVANPDAGGERIVKSAQKTFDVSLASKVQRIRAGFGMGALLVGLLLVALAVSLTASGPALIPLSFPFVLGMAQGGVGGEPQWMDIEGTAVASGSVQEDDVDTLTNLTNLLGTRIFAVEWSVVDWLSGDEQDFPADTRTIAVLSARSRGTTIPQLSSDDMIAAKVWNMAGITTSGGTNVHMEHYGPCVENGAVYGRRGVLVVTNLLYQQFINDTGTTTELNCRVYFSYDKLSMKDWTEAYELWAHTGV